MRQQQRQILASCSLHTQEVCCFAFLKSANTPLQRIWNQLVSSIATKAHLAHDLQHYREGCAASIRHHDEQRGAIPERSRRISPPKSVSSPCGWMYLYIRASLTVLPFSDQQSQLTPPLSTTQRQTKLCQELCHYGGYPTRDKI